MAKQEAKPTPRKGASKVAAAVARAFGEADNTGSIVTQCVSSANSVYRGAEIPTIDLAFIADNVARARKWSAASAQARKSEVRKILRNYRELPEAIQKFCKKSPTFTWHQAVKLARALNSHSTVSKAVTACLTTSVTQAPTAVKLLTNALTRIANIETRSQKIIAFRRDLSKLVSKHGL